MRVIWTRKALRDREAIWLFLADRSVPYADRVERRLRQRGDGLGRFPYLGRTVGSAGERELSVPDTQYVIVYEVGDDAIRILKLWHSAQDRKR